MSTRNAKKNIPCTRPTSFPALCPESRRHAGPPACRALEIARRGSQWRLAESSQCPRPRTCHPLRALSWRGGKKAKNVSGRVNSKKGVSRLPGKGSFFRVGVHPFEGLPDHAFQVL